MTALRTSSRGTCYLVISATVLVSLVSATLGLCQKPTTPREQLANHRNLYNGDFGVFFWNADIWQQGDERYSAAAIKQCRRRGISPWVSVRMNDPLASLSHGPGQPAHAKVQGV